LELADFISASRNVLNDQVYPEVVRMVGNNLFRVLPPADTPDYDPEEDDPSLEASWPHLQVDFLFHPVEEGKLAKNNDFFADCLRVFLARAGIARL
jgi:Protein phosphatase 2A regulatory B subunit (B56 family)